MKTALITGVTGQDGSYLAELLLSKGYDVHGLKRRASSFNTSRVDEIFQSNPERFHLHYADLSDQGNLSVLIDRIWPEEIYNLAAQSHVQVSFEMPAYTADITALGALRLLEAIRQTGCPARFYQASSSEMFGNEPAPQSEGTPFHPRSPYACAKAFAHYATVNYREAYGIHASCGILFNHESERRGETFVTRKITRAVANIKAGLQSKLQLGNLEARRDWGYAPDYVEAMWKMLQQDEASDYVIGTGEAHSVKEFAQLAFRTAGLDWSEHVETDPRYFRPAEVNELCADTDRAWTRLGWYARTDFARLVTKMVQFDMGLRMEKAGAEKASVCHG